MDIQDAQREMRFVYISGFWGQLVSSVIWLGVRSAGHLGHSESVCPGRHHRRILHFPAYSNGAGYVGSHFATALSRTDFLA